eukprot:g63337.t1
MLPSDESPLLSLPSHRKRWRRRTVDRNSVICLAAFLCFLLLLSVPFPSKGSFASVHAQSDQNAGPNAANNTVAAAAPPQPQAAANALPSLPQAQPQAASALPALPQAAELTELTSRLASGCPVRAAEEGRPCVLLVGLYDATGATSEALRRLQDSCTRTFCMQTLSLPRSARSTQLVTDALTAAVTRRSQSSQQDPPGQQIKAQSLFAPWAMVLLLGHEHTDKGLRVETVAMNVRAREGRAASANSALPCPTLPGSGAIADDGPCLLTTTADTSRLQQALDNAETQSLFSRDAGADYNNELFYRMLYAVRALEMRQQIALDSSVEEPVAEFAAAALYKARQAGSQLLPVLLVHLPAPGTMSPDQIQKFILRVASTAR